MGLPKKSVVLVVLLAIAAFVPTFWMMGLQYAVAVSALVVAFVACIVNLASTNVMLRSVRPFVGVLGPITLVPEGTGLKVRFRIANRGTVPAEDVQTSVAFFEPNEPVTPGGEGTFYQPPKSTNQGISECLFPSAECVHVIALDSGDTSEAAAINAIRQANLKMRIGIRYSASGRHFHTVQTLRLIGLLLAHVEFETVDPTLYK